LSAVTAHAGGSLAVWIGEDSAVHATRLDSAGHVIGSPDLELGASVASPYVRPAAAWNGERSLVAWAGGAALVEADGGTHAIDIDGCADVRVAPDGSGFLLLCMQSEPSPIPGGPGRSWTDSVTVTSSGTIGTRSLLVSAFVDAVIEDSGGQLVVWSECGGVYPETCRSRIARLEDGGLVPDSMVLFPESLVGAVVFALVRDPVGVLLAWLGDAGHATLARWDGTALGPPVEVDAAPSVSSGIALDASPTTPPIVVYEVGGLVYGRFLSL
jgi:hypothetical protein